MSTMSEPADIYICSCLDCQRLSGSSFTYCAVFPAHSVSITGGRTWRYRADSGRWLETIFCPTCGCLVGYTMEAFPESVVVSVGCFADPDFPKPKTHYFATRCHHWLDVHDDIAALESQDY